MSKVCASDSAPVLSLATARAAKALSFPRNLIFEIVMDEMPLYREGRFRGGYVSGRFEVSCDIATRDWWISDVVIDMDNARCGSNAETRSVSLNGDAEPNLYAHLLDRITADYADNIEETIAMEIAGGGEAA
jgi:hypothetical protein